MTELDKKVSDLFMKMIKSWNKSQNISGGVIKFDNDLTIGAYKKTPKQKEEDRENHFLKLNENIFSKCLFELRLNWSIITPDTDKLLFYIKTPYRYYDVPEHDRHTYAEVLDTLENSIQKFEQKKMNEYLEYYKKDNNL